MKRPSLLRALVVASTISTCYADIPWWEFGCAGQTITGATVDQMWDNAKLMTTRAIERLTEAKGRHLGGDQSTASNNAKWMWGTSPTFGILLKDDDRAKLDSVISMPVLLAFPSIHRPLYWHTV